LRGLAKHIEEFNHPPFTFCSHHGDKVTNEKATDVLNYSSRTPKKISPSRDSRAGRNDAEHCGTRRETRTRERFLQVKLEDAVRAEDIFYDAVWGRKRKRRAANS